jgi:hypothetical protein
MTNPLSPLVYGKVVGRLLASIIDSADVGDVPDFPPLTGRVTFTASVPKFLVQGADPPATVAPLNHPYYTAVLDDEGYLSWRGERGVKLPAPIPGTMNPSGWTWRVSFDLEYDGVPVTIAPYNIEIPEYIPGPDEEDPDEGSVGLVDLALASPVPSSTGDAVTRGLSVVSVGLDGNALVFGLDDGSFLPGVEVPAIQDALDAADDAAASQAAAAASATAAQNIVDSFDLNVGTITTGNPGDPASLTIDDTNSPVFVLNGVLPKGDTGDPGPPAPDATSSVKGIIRLNGDLGGDANNPTVPGLAGKANTSHTHVATDITDSTTVGRNVLTAADALAARTAIAAGTSSLVLGTTAGTAAEGNDARLSDARTPAAGTQFYDLCIEVFGKSSARATGTGDFPFGVKLQRAVTFSSVTYRGNTIGGSGNLVVELRKNGSAVSGTAATIAAANVVTGGTVTGSWAFAAGDILTVQITTADTTPGNGLVADIKGLA